MSKEYELAPIFSDLRSQILKNDPVSFGLDEKKDQVWGILMETGFPEAVVTLVAIADGNVSLYYSNGGGIIGIGHHDEPKRACDALLQIAPKFLKLATLTTDYPLPKNGYTRFYFLTSEGIYTYEAKEDDLGNERLPMSSLFHKAHELITQAMIVDEKLRTEQND